MIIQVIILGLKFGMMDGILFSKVSEPTELRLNDGWFIEKASKAQKGSLEYGIFWLLMEQGF